MRLGRDRGNLLRCKRQTNKHGLMSLGAQSRHTAVVETTTVPRRVQRRRGH